MAQHCIVPVSHALGAEPGQRGELVMACSLAGADSQMLLTACDDMHTHLYDVEHASLIEAFSGACGGCLHACLLLAPHCS